MAELASIKVTIPEDVIARDIGDGEMILLDINNEDYYGLDEIGTRVWKALTSGVSVQKSCEMLSKEFDSDYDTLSNDVFEFMEDLKQSGLIKVSDV